ncbi:hypothetical protein TI04_12775 [Achromatium sp. WMS2]|nr:hypothetical protein TI04_12775 [Achromatium sp. WMS2]
MSTDARIQPNVVHSIPKNRQALDAGVAVGIDRRIQLNQPGEEYFKAIITAQPIDWKQLGMSITTAQGTQAHNVLKQFAQHMNQETFWTSSEINVMVE